MKGLFKKDWIVMSQTWILMLVIMVLIIGGMFYFDAGIGTVSFLTIYLMMQGVTMVIPEKLSGWNLYQTTLPISRANAIREKYWFSLILSVTGFAAGLAIVWLFVSGMTDDDLLITSLIGWILALSSLAFGLPMLIGLPKNGFIIGIVGGFVPGSVCIALWTQMLSGMAVSAEMINGQPGAVSFVPDLHIDFLWGCLAAFMALTILSLLVMPVLLSRRDQN